MRRSNIKLFAAWMIAAVGVAMATVLLLYALLHGLEPLIAAICYIGILYLAVIYVVTVNKRSANENNTPAQHRHSQRGGRREREHENRRKSV